METKLALQLLKKLLFLPHHQLLSIDAKRPLNSAKVFCNFGRDKTQAFQVTTWSGGRSLSLSSALACHPNLAFNSLLVKPLFQPEKIIEGSDCQITGRALSSWARLGSTLAQLWWTELAKANTWFFLVCHSLGRQLISYQLTLERSAPTLAILTSSCSKVKKD